MTARKPSRIIEEMRETVQGLYECGVIDKARFEQHLAITEETVQLQRAHEAAAGGYLTAEESDDFMKKRLARATVK